MCVDDRLRARGVQTPGEAAGAVSDLDMSLRSQGVVVPGSVLAELVLQALGIESEHDEVCTGRKIIPRVPGLIVAAGEAAMQAGVKGLRLGIGEDVVSHMFETATQMHNDGIQLDPNTQAARQQLAEQGVSIQLSPLSVGKRAHRAGVFLANLTDDVFDPGAAWDAEQPAYNMDVKQSAAQLLDLRRALSVHENTYLACLALRSLVTAPALPTPVPGQPLQILVHETSVA